MRIATTLILAGGLALAGCGSSDKAKVSEKELASVEAARNTVKIGASKSDTLALFKHGNKTRLGSSNIDGAVIEEWKVEAFHDNDWRKTRDMSVAFLYFINDKLVDSSSSRINYRENAAVVEQWKKSAAK